MGMLTDLIDKTEELLGHSPHPAVVGLPIGAWAVSNVCDMVSLINGSQAYEDTARISMGIGLVGAAGAAITGLRDYGYIPKERPSHAIATKHGIGNAIATGLYAASFMLRLRERQAGPLARLLSLAGGGLAVYTAWLGGVLVEEHGEAVKPVMEQRAKEEKQAKQRHDDSEQGQRQTHAAARR